MYLDAALDHLEQAAEQLRLAQAEEDEGHRLKLEILVTEAEWVIGRVSEFVKELRRKGKAA